MDQCQTVAKVILLSIFIGLACSASIDTASAETNRLNIVDDVIPNADNSTQKVIRVNTLDLPPIVPPEYNTSESSLYNIQPLMAPPAYVSTRKFRKQKQNFSNTSDSPIIRQFPELKLAQPKRPKQKQLHLLYNQPTFDGKTIGKRMKVRVAPGAYPIYYVVAKTNGEFHKQHIKGFRDKHELDKYFDKAEKIGKFNKIHS